MRLTSGREVAAAIASISSVEVLVASIAPRLQRLSSREKIDFLIDKRSKTASTTTSASRMAGESREGAVDTMDT